MKIASVSFITKIPTEVYSRIVGYYRPVMNWNKGKKQEFSERVFYKIPKGLEGNSERRQETRKASSY